jgi:hypothetical protein
MALVFIRPAVYGGFGERAILLLSSLVYEAYTHLALAAEPRLKPKPGSLVNEATR